MIRLVIKGNEQQAREHAALRGFNILGSVPWKETDLNHPSSIILTASADIESVVYWFCERPDYRTGFGYPIGTLLWYQVEES